MSRPRPLYHGLRAVDDPDGRSALADAFGALARGLVHLARTVGFWLGVVLPFLHVPLLFVVGFTETTTPALVGLWALNAVAIVVGTNHEPAPGTTTAAD